MTTPVDIVARLTPYFEAGLHLWVENDGLRFKAPKALMDEELVNLLRQEKAALIRWLKDQDLKNHQTQKASAENTKTFEQVPLQSAPLSSTQAAIWMLYRFSPTNAAYNTAFICELDKRVDEGALEQAVQALVVKHPMLRTTFVQNDANGNLGVPTQQVWKTCPFNMQVEEITDFDKEAIEKAVALEADRPFDLSTDSVLRVKLFKCASGRRVLVATIHHIGADLWSLVLIAEQLKAFYECAQNNEPILITPAAKSYLDHVEWQARYLKSTQGKAAKAFWRQYLSHAPINTTLPEDHPRPAVLTMQSSLHTVELDGEITQRIRQYCKGLGITPFVFMQGVFQLLTANETGLFDFIIGTPSLGRTMPGMDQVVGDFANPIIMRSSLRSANSIAEFFKQIQQSLHAGLEFQEYPFPNVVQDCNPPRDASRTPLFQLMFIWHQATTDHFANNPLITRLWRESGPRGTPYDVMLSVSDLGLKLELNWTYQLALYNEATIERFCSSYVTILSLLLDIDPSNAVASFLKSIDGVGALQPELKHTSKISLGELDITLPKRVAYYRYHHAESIDDIFKQLFVEGNPFESEVLSNAFHEVIFLPKLPYTSDGDIDDALLDEMLSVDQQRFKKSLEASEACTDTPYIHYRHTLISTPHDQSLLTDDKQASASARPNTSSHLRAEQSMRPAYATGLLPLSKCIQADNLVEGLRDTALNFPNNGFTFVDISGSEARYTYATLFQDAVNVAKQISQDKCSDILGMPGGVVILQMDINATFLSIWWGLVIAGYKPLIIAKPSTLNKGNALALKLFNVATSMDDLAVIADESAARNTQEFLGYHIPVLSAKHCVAVSNESLSSPEIEAYKFRNIAANDVAFLQLTSGSTGTPKAIQITHAGVIHHANAVTQHNHYGQDDKTLNWLPFDHVVPLLTTHLKDVLLGIDQVQLSPEAVLADPLLWIKSLSKYGVTHSWSPNFGFQKVIDAFDKEYLERDVDLSHVMSLMNAGEQVLPSTVKCFTDLLGLYGLSNRAVQPAFGMAESCTCITYNNDSNTHLTLSVGDDSKECLPEELARISHKFVDLGNVIPGIEIRIANGDRQVVDEGVIGKLQIRGPVVTPGYLNNPDANQEAFVGEGWFNSGDLGFIWLGRLYLTGREKEMIVANGANLYCYDIERVVSSVEGVTGGLVAAVGVSTQAEKNDDELAVFYVPNENTLNDENNSGNSHSLQQQRSVARQIKVALLASMGIAPSFIFAVNRNEFHRTTSGKIQRSQFKKRFQKGEYNHYEGSMARLEYEGDEHLPFMFGLKWININPLNNSTINADQVCLINGSLNDNAGDITKLSTPLIADAVYASSNDKQFIMDVGSIDELDSLSWFHVSKRLSDYSHSLYGDFEALSLVFVFRSSNKADYFLIKPIIETLRQEVGLDAISAIVADKPLSWQLSQCPSQPVIAWMNRQGALSEPVFVNCKRNAVAALRQPCRIKQGGTYLITGGLGGLGQMLCKKLVSEYNANIILTGRSSLGSDHHKQIGFAKLLSECQHANIRYLNFDPLGSVSLSDAMSGLANNQQPPVLDGVFHLAGNLQQEALNSLELAEWNKTTNPKLEYSEVLLRYLEEQCSDAIFVHFSSLNSFWGGLEAGAYSFANAYQGAMASRANAREGRRYVKSWCIHWGLWENTGISKRFSSQDVALAKNKGFFPLDPNRDLAVLEHLLSQSPDNYYVGMNPYHAHIRSHIDWYTNSYPEVEFHIATSHVEPANVDIDALARQSIRNVIQRIHSADFSIIVHEEKLPRDIHQNPDVAALESSNDSQFHEAINPSNPLETKIAQVWSDVLGTHVSDINRSFFEYGGHSINATQIIVKLNQSLSDDLDYQPLTVAQLFQEPTVAGLARLISCNDSHSDSLSLASCVTANYELPALSLVKSAKQAKSQQAIVMLPTASGLPCVYSEFIARWNGMANLYVVQLPDVRFADSKQQSLRVIGDSIVTTLLESEIDLSHATIFGWSYGGVLAHAVSSILSSLERSPKRLVMLDSGFGKGLHGITFDHAFQQLMFASEFGLLPHDVQTFSHQQSIEERCRYLSRYLDNNAVELSASDLMAYWKLYEIRLTHLLRHSVDLQEADFEQYLFLAKKHCHGQDHLGWGKQFNDFCVQEIDADHQGIVNSQLTVEAIEKLLMEGE